MPTGNKHRRCNKRKVKACKLALCWLQVPRRSQKNEETKKTQKIQKKKKTRSKVKKPNVKLKKKQEVRRSKKTSKMKPKKPEEEARRMKLPIRIWRLESELGYVDEEAGEEEAD